MQISVVIPVKNEATILPNLLRSIKAQKGVELEIIVADAKSTDATREVAQQFGARVVDGGMPGPGRNLGAKHATGDWIFFHDADMVLLDDHFYERLLVEFSKRNADFGTVYLQPDARTFLDRFLHWLFHLYTKASSPWIAHVQGGCFFVKRTWHERAGGFDESVVFAEDMDYAQRLKKMGAKFAYISNLSVQISTRRLAKDGRLNIIWRYIYSEWYMRFKGPIRTELFEYSFDHTPTKRP